MGWRIKSLSEDGVDVLTHTWTVAFFLFISFLVLVIPTNLYPSTSETATLSRFDASCWCPATFKELQVAYANSVCGAAFNAWVEGTYYGPARIYSLTLRPVMLSLRKNDTSGDRNKETVGLGSETKETQSVAAILFLLAVCLRIPHMSWSILSGCTSCINIDQTLQAAKAGDSMNAESQQQLYSRLIKAFSDSFRRRPNISTYLYIFMKFIVILVIIVEIIFVTKHSQVRTHDAGNNTTSRSSHFDHLFSPWEERTPEFDIIFNVVYNCVYEIRSLEIVHDYQFHCLFTRQQIVPQMMNEPTLSDRVLETTDSMLFNVYIMVVSVLIILAVVNVLNTAFLLLNLCRTSSRTRIGLGKSAPFDLLFLIHMARANLSISIATGLANMAAVNTDSGNGEELVKT